MRKLARLGEQSGVVTKALPSRLYLVRLEDGGIVTAHATGRVDKNFVRVIVGDRVRVELTAADGGRGRITEKLP